MDVSKAPVRYIAKCRHCKTVTSEMVTPAMFQAVAGFYGCPERHPMPTCSFRMTPRHGHTLVCRGCGQTNPVKGVKGKVTAHECGSRCMASTSGVCECSCGGRNHGASYGS